MLQLEVLVLPGVTIIVVYASYEAASACAGHEWMDGAHDCKHTMNKSGLMG